MRITLWDCERKERPAGLGKERRPRGGGLIHIFDLNRSILSIK
jgi:hypothetical protein